MTDVTTLRRPAVTSGPTSLCAGLPKELPAGVDMARAVRWGGAAVGVLLLLLFCAYGFLRGAAPWKAGADARASIPWAIA